MSHVTAFAVPATARTSLRAPAPGSKSAAANVVGLRTPQKVCPTPCTLIEKNDFAIRIADESSSEAVDMLVQRMYGGRGYCLSDQWAARRRAVGSSITFEATRDSSTVGTLTVNLGGDDGLNAEALYAREIAAFRRPGLRPCEFTRLAMSGADLSKEALGALFHVGVVFASKVFGATDLFIEVNPRHRQFYCNQIGFHHVGEERICPRVDAPAVLLHKNLGVCTSELLRLGGVRERRNRTFYAYMLTPDDERAMIRNVPAAVRLAS